MVRCWRKNARNRPGIQGKVKGEVWFGNTTNIFQSRNIWRNPNSVLVKSIIISESRSKAPTGKPAPAPKHSAKKDTRVGVTVVQPPGPVQLPSPPATRGALQLQVMAKPQIDWTVFCTVFRAHFPLWKDAHRPRVLIRCIFHKKILEHFNCRLTN